MTRFGRVVLVVGAASRDVAPEDPRGWRLGGAVTYISLALARLGLDVRALVGADAEAAGAWELERIREAGAAVAIAGLRSGPVFENVERSTGRVQHCLATADPIPLTALPRAWTTGFDALVLAPVAGELPDAWATLAGGAPRPLVALGWQGLLRDLHAGTAVTRRPPSSSDLVRAADVVALSVDDLAPDVDLRAAFDLLRPGATLVVTAGERGGTVHRSRAGARADGGEPSVPAAGDGGEPSVSAYPAIPSDGVTDPTGAGDVFLAGMLAAMLVPGLAPGHAPERIGAAAASLVVEAPGTTGVPDLAAVLRRLARAPSLASRRPSAASRPGSGRPSQA